MPYRAEPFATNEVYHVFNRSVASVPIFNRSRDYQRALDLIDFYRFGKPGLRLSHFNRLAVEQRAEFIDSLHKEKPIVLIYAFSLMPTHVHFLVKQTEENGVSRFMRIFQNGYAKYLNVKYHRNGPAFGAMFKARRIETEGQLLAVWRYVTLNPLSSLVVRTMEELEDYKWASLVDYLVEKRGFVEIEEIGKSFRTKDKLREFVLDRADYQKELERIKHLVEWNPYV